LPLRRRLQKLESNVKSLIQIIQVKPNRIFNKVVESYMKNNNITLTNEVAKEMSQYKNHKKQKAWNLKLCSAFIVYKNQEFFKKVGW
jgi:hypothetical protein